MTRVTNRYMELLGEVKRELLFYKPDKDEHCIFTYAEIPWFPGGQVSYFLLENTLAGTLKLVEKCWGHDWNNNHFSLGVFNLDRLGIRTKERWLAADSLEAYRRFMRSISYLPETLESTGYIILDGIEYEMTLSTETIYRHYKWKVPTKEISYFEPLLALLKD